MAEWSDFEKLLRPFAGKKLDDDVFLLEFEVEGTGSKPQQLYLIRETIEPGFDIVKASCGIAALNAVDTLRLFRAFGDLNIGSLQYVRGQHELVSLGIILPLPIIDMSEPGATMAVLHELATASRKVARQVGGFI